MPRLKFKTHGGSDLAGVFTTLSIFALGTRGFEAASKLNGSKI